MIRPPRRFTFLAVPRQMLSFVLPVCDEQETLAELSRRLGAVIEELDVDAEIIFVDDGSTDATFALLVELQGLDPRVKVVRLTRNFGHQIAISAGLDLASGDAAVIMDADLQDPPEVVPELVARWREGYEIVYAVRSRRTVEPWFRRSIIRLSYRLIRRVSRIDIPPDAGDFRLVDRKALEAFRALRETNRYVRGMFTWIGFKQVGVPYVREARFGGHTKYPYRKLVQLAVDGIVGFSNAPLRAALIVGFVVSAASFALAVTAIALKLAGVNIPEGWTSLVVVVSFLSGVQLLLVGMLGLYVARIYDEVKERPLYLVREARGFVPPPQPELLPDTAAAPPEEHTVSPA